MPTCNFCDADVSVTASHCPSCGAEQPSRDDAVAAGSLEDELRILIKSGNKIQAIKTYRDATGAGLAEARDAVERFAAGGILEPRSFSSNEVPENLETEVLNTLSRDGKIAAIKLYRDHTKASLKEAVEAIEMITARHGIAAKKGGCAGMALLVIAAVAAIVTLA